MSTIPERTQKKVYRKSKSDPIPELLHKPEFDPCSVLENLAEDSFGSSHEAPKTSPVVLRSSSQERETSPKSGSSSLYTYVLKNALAKSPVAREIEIRSQSSFNAYYQARIGEGTSSSNDQQASKPAVTIVKKRRSSYPPARDSRRGETKPGAILRPSLFAQYKSEKGSESETQLDKSDLDSTISSDDDCFETVDMNDGIFRSFSVKEFNKSLLDESEYDL